MAARFELKRYDNGTYSYDFIGDDNKILLIGEPQRTLSAVKAAIELVRKNSQAESRFQPIQISDLHWFALTTANNRIIGQSPYFTNIKEINKAIAQIVNQAANAPIGANNIVETNKLRVGSVRTFLDELEKIQSDTNHVLFFRGHADFTYSLKPGIYRNPGWIENEDIMFKELILRCPLDFHNSNSTFQTLVKMQHYSLPTRLLDLTGNPLIALYFACDQIKGKEDAEVIIFKIPKKEIKYFDSDTVSVIANISRRPATFTLPSDPIDRAQFDASEESKYLTHEIRQEKPYFESKINPDHLESVVCVKPKLENARIIKQDGAFFLFGISNNKLKPAEVPAPYIAGSITINNERKKDIRSQLATLGITQGSIYPEVDRVAEYIKELYSMTIFP